MRSVSVMICVLLSLALVSYGEKLEAAEKADNSGWVTYNESDMFISQYHPGSMIHLKERDIIRVWQKIIYKQKMIEESRKAGVTIKITQVNMLSEVNCEILEEKRIETKFYNGEELLESFRDEKDQWKSNSPGSIGAYLMNLVCSKTK